jgi:hypothetical protein
MPLVTEAVLQQQLSRHYRNHIILFTKNSIWIIDSAKMYVLNHMGHFQGIIKKTQKKQEMAYFHHFLNSVKAGTGKWSR